MNSVNLIGRLTRDPESRTTATGMMVTTFTLAVDRRPKQGEEKQADFIRIITFGKTAETCAKYLSKGRQVGITGHIQTGSYEKNGVRHYTTDVICDSFTFVGNSGNSGNSGNGNANAGNTNTAPAQNNAQDNIDMAFNVDDSDIPF